MPPELRVKDYAHVADRDIDPNAHYNAATIDGHVRKCIAAATNALRRDVPSHTSYNRDHISRVLESLRETHVGMRELLARTFEKPPSVDVLVLARLQIEALYSLCLMIEDERYVERYLKHHWKQLYIRYLLEAEERKGLERFSEFLAISGPQSIETLRILSAVSEAERLTVESEELGKPLPPGVQRSPIQHFPTPLRALRDVSNPSRKRMLGRLYFEYQHLCSFAHGAAQSVIFKTFLDDRSPYSKFFDQNKTRDLYEKEVQASVIYSLIGVVQSATEVLSIYPGDIELAVALSNAWQLLSEVHLLGHALWKIRGHDVLGLVPPAGPAAI